MTRHLGRQVLAIAGAAVVLLSGIATSDSAGIEPPGVISALVGSWRGSGTAKATSDADPEKVNCKARYSIQKDIDTLKVEVTCAAANAKGLLVGFIVYTENSSRITGNWYRKWSTSDGEENGTLTGTISNSSVKLNVHAAGSLRARLTLSPQSSRSHMVSLVGIIDGQPQQGMNINFRH